MPEFPEVHIITSELKKALKGSTIKKVIIKENYKVYPSNEIFVKAITGAKILSVKQVAKNIVLQLENGFITIHLAMTGQLLAKKASNSMRTANLPGLNSSNWEKVCFKMELPPNKDLKKTPLGQNSFPKSFYLSFSDRRMFGKISFLTPWEFENLQKKYGPSPLSQELSSQKLSQILQKKKTGIKNFLMEQDKIGGLGNIYVTEALFMAKIHPETKTYNIPPEKIEDLSKSIRKAVKSGISHGGTTLADGMYKDIFGKRGRNQDFLQIYGKSKCPECGSKVEKKKIAGRSSYFCPTCQKKY